MNIDLDGHFDEKASPLTPFRHLRQRFTHWWQREQALCEHWFARAVAWAATRAWQITADWRSVRPIISRASAHLAIIILAVAAIVFSGLNLPQREDLSDLDPSDLASNSLTGMVAQVPGAAAAAPGTAGKNLSIAPKSSNLEVSLRANISRFDNKSTVVRVANPHTEIPKRPRRGVITYTVQSGDTAQSIADAFDLQPTTLLWSNDKLEDIPDFLRIGQQLIILPVDGVYHTVAEDDTLGSIAEKYKVEVEAITGLSYNNLTPPLFQIQEGMQLIVPGGTKPYVPRRVTSYTGPTPANARGTGSFGWPVLGTITQGYWWGHRAIDVGAPTGSAVLAADAGYVTFVGWTDIGYGYLIILDHDNGYSTYYAHLSQMYVSLGQAVSRGQVIGAVGSTGNSTGPHLHLELRYNGVEQNPLIYLP